MNFDAMDVVFSTHGDRYLSLAILPIVQIAMNAANGSFHRR